MLTFTHTDRNTQPLFPIREEFFDTNPVFLGSQLLPLSPDRLAWCDLYTYCSPSTDSQRVAVRYGSFPSDERIADLDPHSDENHYYGEEHSGSLPGTGYAAEALDVARMVAQVHGF